TWWQVGLPPRREVAEPQCEDAGVLLLVTYHTRRARQYHPIGSNHSRLDIVRVTLPRTIEARHRPPVGAAIVAVVGDSRPLLARALHQRVVAAGVEPRRETQALRTGDWQNNVCPLRSSVAGPPPRDREWRVRWWRRSGRAARERKREQRRPCDPTGS